MRHAIGVAFVLLIATPTLAASSSPVIAVAEITSAERNWDTENMRTAIETAISKTRKFTLMERGRLDTLLQERGLSLSGITDGIDSLGGFSGVDYLLYGRIARIELESKYQILLTQCEATIGLDVRTVDVRTGEIRFSESVRLSDHVATGGADENACSGLPMAALEDLALAAAESVAEKLTVSLFPIKVANIDGGRVFLNYGEPFLRNGDFLRVVRIGEGFTDPDTGEVLGAEEVEAGILAIAEVRPRFSIANVLLKREDFGVGDIAHRLATKSEVKAAQAELADCDKARKNEGRRCRKEGQRCDEARAATLRSCGI